MSSNPEIITINLKGNQRNTRKNEDNGENNIKNTERSNIIEVGNSNENERNVNVKNKSMKIDNFAENNISIRNVIDNALFSQLSEINVKLLDFDENLFQRL